MPLPDWPISTGLPFRSLRLAMSLRARICTSSWKQLGDILDGSFTRDRIALHGLRQRIGMDDRDIDALQVDQVSDIPHRPWPRMGSTRSLSPSSTTWAMSAAIRVSVLPAPPAINPTVAFWACAIRTGSAEGWLRSNLAGGRGKDADGDE